MLKNLSGKKKQRSKEKRKDPKPKTRNFLSLRKHVAIGQGLVATHAHDERLQVRPKWAGISLKKQATVLDLRASEVDTHVKGQQVEVRFDKRMYRRFHPAI